jgi:hypothetical protein
MYHHKLRLQFKLWLSFWLSKQPIIRLFEPVIGFFPDWIYGHWFLSWLMNLCIGGPKYIWERRRKSFVGCLLGGCWQDPSWYTFFIFSLLPWRFASLHCLFTCAASIL